VLERAHRLDDDEGVSFAGAPHLFADPLQRRTLAGRTRQGAYEPESGTARERRHAHPLDVWLALEAVERFAKERQIR
jgi:hypothetical protein